MYTAVPSRRYIRSLKRISRHKDFDRQKLDRAIITLKEGRKLALQYQDHELSGKFAGIRECHLQHDVLLLYQIQNNELILLLINIGSHSELFE